MSEKTILIADDNVDLAVLTQSYLDRKGYNVVLAHDGEEALRIARREKVDLILLDITMPKKDGLDVYKALCTSYGRTSIPVLIMTGHEELQHVFEDIEVDGFISKPFKLESLENQVARIFEKNDRPRVILVDSKNNPATSEIINALDQERYKTILVEDLKAFQEIAAVNTPDFVFIEYQRREMPADYFISQIKKVSKDILVAAYTYSGLDFSLQSVKAGADKFLGKPESVQVFFAAIRGLELQRKRLLHAHH